MRLPLPCLVCHQELGAPSLVDVCIEDEHLFRVTCPRGHNSVIGLKQPRFKILFESGALALLDGYYREAVASCAASLERFQEYWLRATLASRGISPAALSTAWKLVSHQSERQFGAFVFAHLLVQGNAPLVLPQDMVKFRNGVVHRGDFPDRQSAVRYVLRVLAIVAPAYRELVRDAPVGIAALEAEQSAAFATAGTVPGKITTILGRALNGANPVDFDAELRLLDLRRQGKGVG